MKIVTIILSLLVAIALVGSAMAVMPGKTVEYEGGDAGKVTFKGDTHGPAQGMKCADCHLKPFAMKKGAFKMTGEDHGKPDFCGRCHDGQKAFSQSTEADCGKCHMKAEAEPAKPEAEPEKPAVEPEKPAVEPEKPAVEPEKPAVEPEKEEAPAPEEEKK